MAPANQVMQEEASLDDEQIEGLMAQLVLAKQASSTNRPKIDT
jgi:hypothetical protein